MATFRYPILIWEDYSGFFFARLADDVEAPGGCGKSKADAVYQIKDYLEWALQHRPWLPPPDFNHPTLAGIRVEVRPEYQADDRIYPCDEPIVFRVPCVLGRSSAGLLICSMPPFGLKFFYQESGKLKDLVTHYTRERMRGFQPHKISRYMRMKSVELDEIVLHSNRKSYQFDYNPDLNTLLSIAEPIGDKKSRRQFSRAWERDREVADLVKRISRERANVLIVGEPGSGKTSVLIEAVREVERQIDRDGDDAAGPPNASRYKHWLTSGARLISGMQYLGEWQERCERVIEELSNINGVLCIDNLLELIRTGTGGVSESLAMFFLPYLQRGELRIIAEASATELDACKRLLPGLVDIFQILNLNAFGRDEAIRVLNRVAATQSRNQKVETSPEITGTIYRLFRRFQPYRAFPGKSIAFLNDLFEKAVRNNHTAISNRDVISQFVDQTGLPEIFLRDDLPLEYDEITEAFRKQVIGQDAACESAARLITTFKAGLNDPNRPLGVLLFCGPTGVGKTEMARSIANYFFGHSKDKDGDDTNERLIRLDMSEFSSWGGAYRFLNGANDEPSDLIKRLRQQPFCVVLFDEIEKADADVFDILLSVFDEGRLTDRYGRVTTFRSAVIIMTSNLGADKMDVAGFESKAAPSYSREAMNFFRPEFFNRIDSIVQFNPLSKEMMRMITAKELLDISQREGLKRNDLRLEWSGDIIDHLISTGFDQRYGARPLQRTIEALVISPLARFLLLYPELKNATLMVSVNEGKEVIFDLI